MTKQAADRVVKARAAPICFLHAQCDRHRACKATGFAMYVEEHIEYGAPPL